MVSKTFLIANKNDIPGRGKMYKLDTRCGTRFHIFHQSIIQQREKEKFTGNDRIRSTNRVTPTSMIRENTSQFPHNRWRSELLTIVPSALRCAARNTSAHPLHPNFNPPIQATGHRPTARQRTSKQRETTHNPSFPLKHQLPLPTLPPEPQRLHFHYRHH